MKTIKQVEFIRVEEVKYMPDINSMEQDVLYVSQEYRLSIHLCLCGCGQQTVLPFRKTIDGKEFGWIHEKDDKGRYTMTPSVGNFSGENPYHAHYIITKNKANFV